MTLFPNQAIAAAKFRDELSLGATAHIDISSVSDATLYGKLLAAEADASRELRVFFEPTVIIPDDAPQSEVDALDQAGTKYYQESSYDYDPEFFQGEKWGYIVSKQKPIISVQSLKFAYPAPSNQLFEIPHEWIRLDRKYGHIRLVPAAMAFSAPLSAFIMQALGGGRTVPFMIQLRYTAGLKNAATDFPDLIDLIYKMATLRMLQSGFLPASGSISADGLSQSSSIDLQKWHDGIADKIATLRDAIHGVRFSVL